MSGARGRACSCERFLDYDCPDCNPDPSAEGQGDAQSCINRGFSETLRPPITSEQAALVLELVAAERAALTLRQATKPPSSTYDPHLPARLVALDALAAQVESLVERPSGAAAAPAREEHPHWWIRRIGDAGDQTEQKARDPLTPAQRRVMREAAESEAAKLAELSGVRTPEGGSR